MKTEHGSKPIRNEQTGYQPTIDAMNQIPPQGEKVTLSDNELIKRCQDWVSKLCKSGGRAWTLRVPVDFNNDPDVLLTELSTRLGRILTASKCETVDGVILKLESLKFKIDKKQDFGGEYQVINTGVDDAMTQPHLSDEEIGKLAIDTGIWQDSEEYYSFIAGYKAAQQHRPNEWVRVEDSKSK